jgi:hypothetical protein
VDHRPHQIDCELTPIGLVLLQYHLVLGRIDEHAPHLCSNLAIHRLGDSRRKHAFRHLDEPNVRHV